MLFGPGRGLFWQTPILLLSAAGGVAWYRSGSRAILAFAVGNIVLYSLSISALESYQGGLTTSMRYLIVALPFFCILLPDIGAFAFKKTLLLLFAVSGVNMFVLAATSTMYGGDYPLSQSAYPDFWRGQVAFNPLLAGIGVRGVLPAVAVAVIFAVALGFLFRGVLTKPRNVFSF